MSHTEVRALSFIGCSHEERICTGGSRATNLSATETCSQGFMTSLVTLSRAQPQSSRFCCILLHISVSKQSSGQAAAAIIRIKWGKATVLKPQGFSVGQAPAASMQGILRVRFSKQLVLTEQFLLKFLWTSLESIRLGMCAFAISVQQMPVSVHMAVTCK